MCTIICHNHLRSAEHILSRRDHQCLDHRRESPSTRLFIPKSNLCRPRHNGPVFNFGSPFFQSGYNLVDAIFFQLTIFLGLKAVESDCDGKLLL